MRQILKLLFILFPVFFLFCLVKCSFIDITNRVGISGISGILAAFGDFNGDKQNDIFVITNGGTKLEIFFWQGSEQKFRKSSRANVQTQNSEKILNVAPGDFDGDGCMDVVITTEPGQSDHQHTQPKTVYIYWGNQQEFSPFSANESIIGEEFRDQPAVADINGDFVPDLFGTKYNKENITQQQRTYWISAGRVRRFIEEPQIRNITASGQSRTLAPLRVPHSNSFLDLTGDMTADLFVTTQNATQYGFEIWENKEGSLQFSPQVIGLPIKSNIQHVRIGQSSFADIDADGHLDMLLPVCTTENCDKSEIYLYSKGKWSKILSNNNHIWKFSNESMPHIPLMILRTGDYNMDGYSDCLTIMDIIIKGTILRRVPVLLENVPCEDHENGLDCAEGRTFSVQWKVLSSLEHAVVATFVDLLENGITDFMIATESKGSYHLHAIRNELFLDASFLKVVVLGGSRIASCSSEEKLPYGVNQAGPFIRYTTTDTDGKIKRGSAAQLYQSGYFALQCPYIVFGLGRTPNFVDELSVGMPRAKGSPMRRRTWPSIIPNSQMIIIPYPPNEPNKWKSKLLVTPSKLLLLTGLALLAICAFIGLIILGLHLKEKRADQKEKRQDAHKFHFDAM